MAALMNVLKEEIATITTTAAASAAPNTTTTAVTTMSRSIMTAVRQEATATTTESSSVLKEIAASTESGLIPKTQLESLVNSSSREMLSNALQQGVENLADPNALDKLAPIAKP